MKLETLLYEHYVSQHLGRLQPQSADQYESYARHYAQVFLPFLPADRTLPVLDVGCGVGRFLYFLRSQGYAAHLGIDIGREQVDLCRDLVTPQVEQVPDTVDFLRARPGHFAAIVFIDVFEHLGDDLLVDTAVAARGALRPGGRLLVSVPNGACLPALVTRYGDLTHKRLFTEGSLEHLLRAVGFAEVAVVPNEKRVSRSFASRRERWMWTARDRLARWILSELHLHLMEGSYPRVQTVNLLGVATLPDGPPSAHGTG
jgi:2-polyprenyl-3-methyl-5-hydroxy-6-metoxy-1,4-benzoquinol methylase